MSQPSSLSSGSKTPPKQSFNVDTMMLIVSFLALTLGSICLAKELSAYGWPPWDVKSAAPASES